MSAQWTADTGNPGPFGYRHTLSWRKPGCVANRLRSSSSLVLSLRLPMNKVLQGGLSFVLLTGTYERGWAVTCNVKHADKIRETSSIKMYHLGISRMLLSIVPLTLHK